METTHTVVARFDEPDDAREAMIDLEVKGIDADAIRLVAPSAPVPAAGDAARGVDLDVAGGLARRAAKGALLGALIGAALLVAVLTIARVEPLGTALLSGVVAGAIGGSLIGGYWSVSMRLPVNAEAFDTYAIDPQNTGGVAIAVRVDDARVAADAVAVLRAHHASEIDREVA